MATVDHDKQTGLLALRTAETVTLLDPEDLAIAGAALIRLAAAGHPHARARLGDGDPQRY